MTRSSPKMLGRIGAELLAAELAKYDIDLKLEISGNRVKFVSLTGYEIETKRETKKMSVVFLFNQTLTSVLMVTKNRGPYPGALNGVGGKYDEVNDWVTPCPTLNMGYCAQREVSEETSFTPDLDDLCLLVTEIFPPGGSPPWGRDIWIELWVYCGVVDENSIKQTEDEQLSWMPTTKLLEKLPTDRTLAGSGNIPYFINLALMRLEQVWDGN